MKNILFKLLLIFPFIVCSQQMDQPKFWDKVQFGGGLGIGFGSNSTVISVSPSAIYNFNQYIATGIDVSYLYAKQNNVKSNVFGTGIITLFNPIEQLQASAEFKQYFVNQKWKDVKTNFDFPALYLGLAYRIQNFSLGFQYDVLYDKDHTIYASPFSPIVRFYF